MTIADLARRAAKLAVDNSPTILTAFGTAGVLATAYFAGRASYEASDIIRLQEAVDNERGVTLGTPKEVLAERTKLVWRLYIPAATMGAATIACIIGANRISAGRAAGLATAYTILEKNFSDQKAKIVQKIGERKAEALDDEIMQERVAESYDPTMHVHGLPTGEIVYDKFSDRYFYSNVEGLRGIENDFNHGLIHSGFMSLGDFYRLLDLPAPTWTENLGWSSDRLLELKIGTQLSDDNKPILCMDFRHDPLPDYGRFR
jgi:hypothetical protein